MSEERPGDVADAGRVAADVSDHADPEGPAYSAHPHDPAHPRDPAHPEAPLPPARTPRPDSGALVVSAVVAVVVGLGLWAAARESVGATVVGVGIIQAALIATWMLGLRVPGRIGGVVVCTLAAAAADTLAVVFPADQLGVLAAPLGLLVLAVFVAQLCRGVVRVRVVESVSDIAVLGIAVVAAASLIVLRHRVLDAATAAPNAAVPVVLVVGAALAFSALGDRIAPVPRFDPQVERGLFGVVLAAVAGAVAGWSVLHGAFGFGPQRGAFLGGALGIVVALLAVGSSFLRAGTAPPIAADLVGPTDRTDPTSPVATAAPETGAAHAGEDDGALRRPLADLAVEEVLVENDAATATDPAWTVRLQPVAALLWAFALSTPVGYLLTVALGG